VCTLAYRPVAKRRLCKKKNSRCYAIGEDTNNRFLEMVKVLLDYNKGNGVFYAARFEMLLTERFEATS
jgi:hypothetical protein